MYYRICERCGAHLDPGETCDCQWIDEPEMEMCQSRCRRTRGWDEMMSLFDRRETDAYDLDLA